MNLPASDSREDVAKWLGRIFIQTRLDTKSSKQANLAQADAVLALVQARVDAVTRERDEAVRVLVATLNADNEIQVGDVLVFPELDTESGETRYTIDSPRAVKHYDTPERAIAALLANAKGAT